MKIEMVSVDMGKSTLPSLFSHYLFIILVVDDKDKGSVNIASLLWVDC